jgi:DNA mismatch repair protein MutS
MSARAWADGPPVWQQYQRFKRQHPDAILLFRMGDFYETFDEDAQLIARELEIALTGREMGKGRRHPLAGIPYHALDGHLARLVARGHRVAICEQTGDPATSRGLVDRAVTRVVTPGTVAEPGLLDAKRNNYLAALALGDGRAGLAHMDVTTGEFRCCAIEPPRGRPEELVRLVAQELERIGAAEVLVPTAEPRRGVPPDLPPALAVFTLTPYDAWRFGPEAAAERLKSHFGVRTLEGFGCADDSLAAGAAGALVQYLAETNAAALGHLDGLRSYGLGEFMALDAATRRNLELTAAGRAGGRQGSLLAVLDRTRTAMGGRMLRRWLAQPLLSRRPLEERLDAVEALVGSGFARARVAGHLAVVADLERLVGRCVATTALPRELLTIRDSLRVVPAIRGELEGLLPALAAELPPTEALADLVERAIVPEPPATLGDGGVIRPGYSPELDALVESTRDARAWMAGLEARERDRTGVRGLRVGYNKVFGYYIEVSSAALRVGETQARLERECGYVRKQTLVGAERYVTQELKQKEELVLEAQERIVALEGSLFRRLLADVAAEREWLLRVAAALARLDTLVALAEVASASRYVRPTLTDDDAIEIVAGRHPVVEQSALDAGFVPNDTRLSCREEQVLIITGPNMAGKSTYLRQVGLLVLMAQIGSFVPAEQATIGLVDRIFTRVGAQDDIATGQSTFMVEMAETANILHHATGRSLVILDEIGRGTSTFDGMAIARAIVEFVHDHPRLGCKTLFATHYHELTELERRLPRVRNLRVEVLEEGERVVFLHRVVPGGADRSYGIHVARLAGIPASVTQRARDLLKDLESGRRRAAPARANGHGPGLFDPPRDPLLEELAALQPDGLTPLQALNKLYDLRERARATIRVQ